MAFGGFSAMITSNNSTFLPAYLLNKEQIKTISWLCKPNFMQQSCLIEEPIKTTDPQVSYNDNHTVRVLNSDLSLGLSITSW